MDLRSIRYFVQIADLGSITRASQHLGIAQPDLSRHVRSIDEQRDAAAPHPGEGPP